MTPAEQALRDRIRRRSAAISPEIARRQLAAYDLIARLLNESELARAVSTGTLDGLLARIFSDAELDPLLDNIRTLLDGLTIKAGRKAFADLPKAFREVSRLRSAALYRKGFSILSPRVLDAARRLDTRVIEGLKAEIRETVRQRAMAGLELGENPRATARAMREVLGLAPNQEEAIRNFERMLRAGDREALTRALRDKRFDATLKRAFEAKVPGGPPVLTLRRAFPGTSSMAATGAPAGTRVWVEMSQFPGFRWQAMSDVGAVGRFRTDEAMQNWVRANTLEAMPPAVSGLTDAQVRTMTDAYRRRMVAFNAETHARSAALDINRLAQRLSWEDAIEAGVVDRTRLMRKWITVGDSRVRPEHQAMNGKDTTFDEPYENGEMIPGDSTYNCRCIERYFLSPAVRLVA